MPPPSKWLRLVVMRCEMWMILCLLDMHVILLRKMEIQEKKKLLLHKVILLYRQELIEERIAYIQRTEARGKLRESEKRLSQNIYERGVDDAGFGRIRSGVLPKKIGE